MKIVVFIGDKFYKESGSMMSSIYLKTSNGFQRYDWGFLELALEEGEQFLIRQASQEELSFFEEKLANNVCT